MKLIDILVEELPKHGGWPEAVREISTHASRRVFFDGRFAPRGLTLPMASDAWNRCKHPRSYTNAVTREQYEAALAAKNDGWIEWGGGECPVDTKAIVDIKLKGGFAYKSCHAGDYSWRHAGGGGDIISYRLHKPQEVTEADGEADLNECIGQDVAPAWNGEGLPPVGCECEYSLNAGVTWWKCKIDYIVGTQGVVMLCDAFEGVQYVQFSSYGSALKFRPIISEADRKRYAAIESLFAVLDAGVSTSQDAIDVYDAIAAGKIPGVRLED